MDSEPASELRQRQTRVYSPTTAGDRTETSSPRVRSRSQLLTEVANPFSNPAPWTRYEIFKAIVVGTTLLPPRLATFLICFPIQILVAKIASIGCPLQEDRGCFRHTEPLAAWRSLLLWPITLTNRGILWSLGFWRIKVVDHRKNPKRGANLLVVAPHQTMTDPFVVATAFPPLPSGVGKYELLKMPGLSAMAMAGQGIFVNRKNADSRHACKDAIAVRADPAQWKGPPTMIFPEGTTSNGNVLIQFKLGPFCPGLPVLPVCLRYPWKHYNPGWTGNNDNLGLAMLRMMLQFANFCEMHILEPYVPSEKEKEDPKLFAENVRKLMAEHLDVSTTEHSYDDLFLMSNAKAHQGSDFEVAEVKSLYQFSLDNLKHALKVFEKFDRANSGFISHEEFSQAVRDGVLGPVRSSSSIDHLFNFFDTDGSGSIAYREFLQGLALLSNKCSKTSRAELAFLIYDVEGTGKVQRGVLRKALNDAVAHKPRAESSDEQEMGRGRSPSIGDQILSGGDSEEINLTDFMKLVQSQPEMLEAALELARTRLGLPELGTQDDAGHTQ